MVEFAALRVVAAVRRVSGNCRARIVPVSMPPGVPAVKKSVEPALRPRLP
jgi:hypothetical protein